MTDQYECIIKILTEKIACLQKAIQYIDAGFDDDSNYIIVKIAMRMATLEKRIEQLRALA